MAPKVGRQSFTKVNPYQTPHARLRQVFSVANARLSVIQPYRETGEGWSMYWGLGTHLINLLENFIGDFPTKDAVSPVCCLDESWCNVEDPVSMPLILETIVMAFSEWLSVATAERGSTPTDSSSTLVAQQVLRDLRTWEQTFTPGAFESDEEALNEEAQPE